MAPRSRRRNQAVKRTTRKPGTGRRSPRKRIRINWGRALFRVLIALILIADGVLLIFVVKRCAEPPVVVEEVQKKALPPKEIPEDRPLQIEVLNGCGAPGMAAKFTNYLREAGFDVVKTDNYESHNVEQTLIIERKGILKNGFKVADALGLNRSRVLQEVSDVYLIDATIILGRDFRAVQAWQDMENSGG